MKQTEFTFMEDVPKEAGVISLSAGHKDNQKMFAKHRVAFKRIFKRNIADFKDAIFGIHIGFKIVKFDDEIIKSEDGVSCREKLLKVYGQEAHDMIEELINPSNYKG